MFLKIVPLCAGVATLLAHKRFLPGVHSAVNSQAGALRKLPSAHLTRKAHVVRLIDMLVVQPLAGEALGAGLTGKHLLGVRGMLGQLMVLAVGQRSEAVRVQATREAAEVLATRSLGEMDKLEQLLRSASSAPRLFTAKTFFVVVVIITANIGNNFRASASFLGLVLILTS